MSGEEAQSSNLQMQMQLQTQRQQMQQQQLQLHAFWQSQIQDISQIDPNAFDFKTHQLPLARIKKIMKTDEDVRVGLWWTDSFGTGALGAHGPPPLRR